MAFSCPAWSLLSETRDNTIVAQASPDLTRTQHISERASTHGIYQQALYLIDVSHSLLYADHSGFGSFDASNLGELPPSTTFALGKPAHISGSQN